jgi:hypothetical protein
MALGTFALQSFANARADDIDDLGFMFGQSVASPAMPQPPTPQPQGYQMAMPVDIQDRILPGESGGGNDAWTVAGLLQPQRRLWPVGSLKEPRHRRHAYGQVADCRIEPH